MRVGLATPDEMVSATAAVVEHEAQILVYAASSEASFDAVRTWAHSSGSTEGGDNEPDIKLCVATMAEALPGGALGCCVAPHNAAVCVCQGQYHVVLNRAGSQMLRRMCSGRSGWWQADSGLRTITMSTSRSAAPALMLTPSVVLMVVRAPKPLGQAGTGCAP